MSLGACTRVFTGRLIFLLPKTGKVVYTPYKRRIYAKITHTRQGNGEIFLFTAFLPLPDGGQRKEMDMASDKLTLKEKIEREEKKLQDLTAKRDELNKKIRRVELNLSNYRLMENDNKLSAMNALAEGVGISVDEIMTALQNGELLSLQEKIEAAAKGEVDTHGEDGENTAHTEEA